MTTLPDFNDPSLPTIVVGHPAIINFRGEEVPVTSVKDLPDTLIVPLKPERDGTHPMIPKMVAGDPAAQGVGFFKHTGAAVSSRNPECPRCV